MAVFGTESISLQQTEDALELLEVSVGLPSFVKNTLERLAALGVAGTVTVDAFNAAEVALQEEVTARSLTRAVRNVFRAWCFLSGGTELSVDPRMLRLWTRAPPVRMEPLCAGTETLSVDLGDLISHGYAVPLDVAVALMEAQSQGSAVRIEAMNVARAERTVQMVMITVPAPVPEGVVETLSRWSQDRSSSWVHDAWETFRGGYYLDLWNTQSPSRLWTPPSK